MSPTDEAKDKPQISQMTRMKSEEGSVLGLRLICVICEICVIRGSASDSLVAAWPMTALLEWHQRRLELLHVARFAETSPGSSNWMTCRTLKGRFTSPPERAEFHCIMQT